MDVRILFAEGAVQSKARSGAAAVVCLVDSNFLCRARKTCMFSTYFTRPRIVWDDVFTNKSARSTQTHIAELTVVDALAPF